MIAKWAQEDVATLDSLLNNKLGEPLSNLSLEPDSVDIVKVFSISGHYSY